MNARALFGMFLLVVLAPAAAAFHIPLTPSLPGPSLSGADWLEVPVRFSWDLAMSGFCAQGTQCLVHLQGNPDYDGNLERWYTATAQNNPGDGPRCLNATQYANDFVCENGNWSTRTRQVALQLLELGRSAEEFTLFCDTYDRALNQYHYLLQNTPVESYLDRSCFILGTSVPCVNTLCVLKTTDGVVLGASLNVPLNDTSKSFLKALDKSTTLCNSVSKTAAVFAKCRENEPLWFNPAINSIIWLQSGTLPAADPGTSSLLTQPLATLSQHVMKFLHQKNNAAMNFEYFPRTRLFNRFYLAQKGAKSVFGFLETGLRPEVDPVPIDYIGIRYENIDLGQNPCLNVIKRYDSKAFCENQTGTGFNVIARQRCERDAPCVEGASPLVDVFPALTGKLRP
jgi:hypothetical protein